MLSLRKSGSSPLRAAASHLGNNVIRFGGRRALIRLLCGARFYRLGLQIMGIMPVPRNEFWLRWPSCFACWCLNLELGLGWTRVNDIYPIGVG